MTRFEVHRRALLATAKIAFGVTAACASDPPPPQTPTTPAGPSTQTGSPAATAPPSTNDSTSTGPNGCALPSASATQVSEAEEKCCLEAANEAQRKGPAPDHIKKCCDTVIATRTSVGYNACCHAIGSMNGGCTPWGPPVPPRMARLRA